MKAYRILIACFAVALFIGVGYAQDRSDGSQEHETMLREIQQAIEEKGASWTAGDNDIFRLSREEQMQLYGVDDSVSVNRIPESEQVMRYAWHPEKFDWRSTDGGNWMSPITNQGACGSCVGFSTMGVLEGQLNIHHNNPNLNMDLSEAHLFFCSGGNCDSGCDFNRTFDYLKENGVPEESCFPYTAGRTGSDQDCDETCPDWRDQAVSISCWGWVGGNSDVRTPAEIKEQILKGPVGTYIVVYEDFNAYSSGIYEHVWGEELAGHAIVFVGWDDTTDPPCWITRNSWGNNWGENGYFRIRMGTNEIGIESGNAYMVLGDVPEGEVSDNGHLYGKVDIGDSEAWELKINNVGSADLEVYGFTADTAYSAFEVTPPSEYPQAIAPGEILSYMVVFAPDTIGFQYVRMNVLSNSCRILPDLKLRGTGVIHSVKAAPKAIEETMDQGKAQAIPITIIYQGDTILTYTVEVLREWLSVAPDSGTIEAGGSAEFTVTFETSSLEPGEHRTNILIRTDDPTDGVVVVPVTLFVMEAAGVAVTLPPMINPIDQRIDLALSVDNKNNIEMPITNLSMQIDFDVALLQLLDIVPTSRITAMSSFQWEETEPGLVTLSVSDGNGEIITPGTEPVAKLSFSFQKGTACGDSAWIDVSEVALTDTLGALLEVRISDGLIISLCKGDIDANGAVEISDVIQAVQFILENACSEDQSAECWAADFNGDERINTLDLIGMINVILGREGAQ